MKESDAGHSWFPCSRRIEGENGAELREGRRTPKRGKGEKVPQEDQTVRASEKSNEV